MQSCLSDVPINVPLQHLRFGEIFGAKARPTVPRVVEMRGAGKINCAVTDNGSQPVMVKGLVVVKAH